MPITVQILSTVLALPLFVAAGWLTHQLLGPYARAWVRRVRSRDRDDPDPPGRGGRRFD